MITPTDHATGTDPATDPASDEDAPSRGLDLFGLPQFVRYASTYPSPRALFRALQAGPLRRRGMVAGFLWILVDDTHLVSIASMGWPRDLIDRYSVMPMELDIPAVHAVRNACLTIEDAEGFGDTYMDAIDSRFLSERFRERGAVSAVNTPLRHAGIVVGDIGFVTDRPWIDDADGRVLLTAIGDIVGLWATHPRSRAMSTPNSGSPREWSLAFSPRQKEVLTLAGEGLSNTDIARRLLVSHSAIKQDLHQAMRALRTHSRQGAYDRALALGLLR